MVGAVSPQALDNSTAVTNFLKFSAIGVTRQISLTMQHYGEAVGTHDFEWLGCSGTEKEASGLDARACVYDVVKGNRSDRMQQYDLGAYHKSLLSSAQSSTSANTSAVR